MWVVLQVGWPDSRLEEAKDKVRGNDLFPGHDN